MHDQWSLLCYTETYPKEKRLPCLDPSKPRDMNTAIGKPGENTSNNLQQLFWKPGRNINLLQNNNNTTAKTYKQKHTKKHQTQADSQTKRKNTTPTQTQPIVFCSIKMSICHALLLSLNPSLHDDTHLFISSNSPLNTWGPRALRTPNFAKRVLPEVMH